MSVFRNLTHLAIVEYLESQPPLRILAADLDDTVDGNVLIDAVKFWKSASPAAIRPYFKEESPIGALGALAQRLHLFVVTEAEVEKQHLKQKKCDLTEEKLRRPQRPRPRPLPTCRWALTRRPTSSLRWSSHHRAQRGAGRVARTDRWGSPGTVMCSDR